MKVVLAHGPAGLFDFFPLLFIGAGIWVILKVLRDGQGHASRTPKLPTTPWSRQVASATRKRGPVKPVVPTVERPGHPRRTAAPHLRVMDGAVDLPRRFEPPPGRRTG